MPNLNLLPTIQQAISNLLTVYEPEFLRFGYRGAHAAAKGRSGFRQYRSGGARLGGRSGRGRVRPFDPHVAEEILS